MEVDYIVVGGGSAGCVLAARLSEDPSVSVALLEAGGNNDGVLNRVPTGAAVHIVGRNAYNWAFSTVPQPGFAGRRGYQPRGRGLGGSSSINAMVYLRGQREDYDDWVAEGATGWGWNDVLPYFRSSENNERPGLDGAYHGRGGPLNVADLRSPHPFAARFIEAAQQAGLPRNDDFAGESQEGVGWYQVTQKNGERWSVARAYLDPARGRPNLKIEINAFATQVLFDGHRAVGVRFEQGGQAREVRARREVLLAAGALQSPQLLMVSGVGPGSHLQGTRDRDDRGPAGRRQPAGPSGHHRQSSRRQHRPPRPVAGRRLEGDARDRPLAARAARRADFQLRGGGRASCARCPARRGPTCSCTSSSAWSTTTTARSTGATA